MFNGAITHNQYVVLSDRNNIYESGTVRKLRDLAIIADKYNTSQKEKNYEMFCNVAKNRLGLDIKPLDKNSYSEFRESEIFLGGFKVGMLANSTRMFPDRLWSYTKPDYEGMNRFVLPMVMSNYFGRIRMNLTENPKFGEHIEQVISICDQIEKFRTCSFLQLNFITYSVTKGHPPKSKDNG